jgi:hypothetical protein
MVNGLQDGAAPVLGPLRDHPMQAPSAVQVADHPGVHLVAYQWVQRRSRRIVDQLAVPHLVERRRQVVRSVGRLAQLNQVLILEVHRSAEHRQQRQHPPCRGRQAGQRRLQQVRGDPRLVLQPLDEQRAAGCACQRAAGKLAERQPQQHRAAAGTGDQTLDQLRRELRTGGRDQRPRLGRYQPGQAQQADAGQADVFSGGQQHLRGRGGHQVGQNRHRHLVRAQEMGVVQTDQHRSPAQRRTEQPELFVQGEWAIPLPVSQQPASLGVAAVAKKPRQVADQCLGRCRDAGGEGDPTHRRTRTELVSQHRDNRRLAHARQPAHGDPALTVQPPPKLTEHADADHGARWQRRYRGRAGQLVDPLFGSADGPRGGQLQ